MPGALVGPTFSHIIARQISNVSRRFAAFFLFALIALVYFVYCLQVKRGDRFWYSHGDLGTSGFSREQTDELRKSTVAALFCTNTPTLAAIQPRVFEAADERT